MSSFFMALSAAFTTLVAIIAFLLSAGMATPIEGAVQLLVASSLAALACAILSVVVDPP